MAVVSTTKDFQQETQTDIRDRGVKCGDREREQELNTFKMKDEINYHTRFTNSPLKVRF